MSSLAFTFRAPLVATVLVASLISAGAGDAIVFSPDKAKAAPSSIPPDGKQGPTVVEKLRPSDLDVDPDRGSRPQSSPEGRRTRVDRKRQAELDEKRNWLLLRPGELQEEEAKKENGFGVREHDKWEVKTDANGRRDYTFHGLGAGKRDDAKVAPQATGNNPQASKGEGVPDQNPDEPAPAGPHKKPGLSPHSAQELDFRGFFPGDDSKEKENAAKTAIITSKEDENSAMMKELIGNPSAARREQQERVDKFNLMLKTPPSILARSIVGSSESAQPVAPAPAIPDSPARFGGTPLQIPSAGQRPDSAAGLRGQPAAGSWNDPNLLRGIAPNRPAPGASGNNNPWDATLQQQQQLNKPSVARPLVIEPPARRF